MIVHKTFWRRKHVIMLHANHFFSAQDGPSNQMKIKLGPSGSQQSNSGFKMLNFNFMKLFEL